MKKTALIAVLSLAACGTLFNGSSQDIRFDSNVKGVQIVIDGLKICRTPCMHTMERLSSPVTIVAKKEGYEDQVSVLKSELSKKALFNTLAWPSWLTDLFSGGMWQYNRSGVYIEMQPLQRQQGSQGYYRYSKNDETGAKTRYFSLFNYGELKYEAAQNQSGEYIKSLAELSGKNEKQLIQVINKASDEVNLAHTLTDIK